LSSGKVPNVPTGAHLGGPVAQTLEGTGERGSASRSAFELGETLRFLMRVTDSHCCGSQTARSVVWATGPWQYDQGRRGPVAVPGVPAGV